MNKGRGERSKAGHGAVLLFGRFDERQRAACRCYPGALDAVLVGLLTAVAHECRSATADEAVGIVLNLAPQGGRRPGHRRFGREKHVDGHRLAGGEQAEVTLDAVVLAVHVARSVALAGAFVATRRHAWRDPLQEDVSRFGQIDALDVDVGFRCVRPVEVRAEPHLDDEIHANHIIRLQAAERRCPSGDSRRSSTESANT
jgi:hypothetical protein